MVKRLLGCNLIQSFLKQDFHINKLLSFFSSFFFPFSNVCFSEENNLFQDSEMQACFCELGWYVYRLPGCHLSCGCQALFTLSVESGSVMDLEFTKYRMDYLTTASTIFASSVLRCQWCVSTLSFFAWLWGLKSSPQACEVTPLLTYLSP